MPSTRNSQESQEEMEARVVELRCYEFGNASEVGQRKGEKAYEPVGTEKEAAEDQKVSILRKNRGLSNDIHMKIIELHEQEKQQEQLEAKHNASFCSKILRFLTRAGDPYTNQHPIDSYIDRYWLVHCPEDHSVS